MRSTQVRSMNIDICNCGSSRKNWAIGNHASGATRAHSSPCCEPVSTTSAAVKRSSNLSRTIFAIALASRPRGRPNRSQGNVETLFLLQHDLTVSFAALDALLQKDQSIERLFRPWRAARNVDVHRDDLIRTTVSYT